VSETEPPTTSPAPTKEHHRARTIGAWVLLVVAVVLAPFAATAIWARNQITDTDRYLATVGPLAKNPDVEQYVAQRLSAAITDALDVQSALQGILPPALQSLAKPIAAAVDSAIDRAATSFTQSEAFEEVWVQANRVAHQTISKVLTGKKPPALQESNGQIVIDLKTAAKNVQQQLVDNGYTFLANLSLDRVKGQIVLMDADSLKPIKSARSLVGVLQSLAYVLPVVVIGCFVASILLFLDRRKGLLRAGVGLMIGMLVVGVAVAIAQNVVVNAVNTAVVPKAVTTALFRSLTLYLRRGFRLVFAFGAVMALAGAVLVLSRGKDGRPTGFARWVAANRIPLWVVVPIAGLVWLVLLDSVPPLGLAIVVVLILVLEGAIAVVAASVRREEATATPVVAAP
jgi:hypothetical protein